jgi:phosphate transport system protein
MYETRHQYREDLKELESQTLDAIDLVIGQLDRALESLRSHDIALAETVVADDARIDGRYLEIHQGVLSQLARQTPVAGDLRLLAALLHMIRCVERIGDQCVNIAKLVPLAGEQATNDTAMLDAIERMARLARDQLTDAREAFTTRNVRLAQNLAAENAGIGRLNREIFNRAVEIGDDVRARESAMFMILVARALERIANNAVDIAEQTVFIAIGLFREFAVADPTHQ